MQMVLPTAASSSTPRKYTSDISNLIPWLTTAAQEPGPCEYTVSSPKLEIIHYFCDCFIFYTSSVDALSVYFHFFVFGCDLCSSRALPDFYCPPFQFCDSKIPFHLRGPEHGVGSGHHEESGREGLLGRPFCNTKNKYNYEKNKTICLWGSFHWCKPEMTKTDIINSILLFFKCVVFFDIFHKINES